MTESNLTPKPEPRPPGSSERNLVNIVYILYLVPREKPERH